MDKVVGENGGGLFGGPGGESNTCCKMGHERKSLTLIKEIRIVNVSSAKVMIHIIMYCIPAIVFLTWYFYDRASRYY